MLTVVMPAHNEQEYLGGSVSSVLMGLTGLDQQFEILVVENGSTDGTSSVASMLARDHQQVRSLNLPQADYGVALRTGLLAASGDWVVIFDVDYVDLNFLRHARRLANQTGAAIVVGSKRTHGSEDQRSWLRQLITAVFTGMLRAGFGLKVSDTHGLKLLHLPQLRSVIEDSRHGREIFDTELILRAERAHLGVIEIPVRVADQRPPRSSILRRIPRTLLGLIELRISLWCESLHKTGRRVVTG